jgi:hypothetical protein
VDRRGLRHFTKAKKLENTVKLQTFKLKAQASGQAPPGQRDLFEVGLVHSLHWVDMEPVDTGVIQNLFLTGQLKLAPGERLWFGSYAHLGIGDNAGDFRLSGELAITLKRLGTLRLEAVNQLYSPSLLHQRYYVSQHEAWKHSFGKTLETSLAATYELPQYRLTAGAQNHLLNNVVYFGEDGLPRQSGTFNIVQFIFRKDFQLGPFHLDNQFVLQEATSEVLALPPWYGRHSLYFEGKIFKKVMLTRLGADARLIGPHRAPGYLPVTGQFHLQGGQSLPFTPLLDAHLSFKVKTFRFFFKIENLLTYPLQDYYFQTAGYPLPFGFRNGGVRMGISWRLVD